MFSWLCFEHQSVATHGGSFAVILRMKKSSLLIECQLLKTRALVCAPKFLCVCLKTKCSLARRLLQLYLDASLRGLLQVLNSSFLWLMGSVDVASVVEQRQMLENSIASPLSQRCVCWGEESPRTLSLSSISIIRACDLTGSLYPGSASSPGQ